VKKLHLNLSVASISFLVATAAMNVSNDAPAWWSASLAGDATADIANENAYAAPVPTLPTTDLRRFTFGNRIFNTNWVIAPSSVPGLDGLGPVFNRVSCSACHTRDGRGRPPESAEQSFESMLVRLSIPGSDAHGGVQPVPRYGDQLNEKAIPNVPAEGHAHVRYTEREGYYVDGTRYVLAVPHYEFTDLAFGSLPPDVMFSPRIATPVFGLGLLEAVPEVTILTLADPDDRDHDGVSGRANRVWDIVRQQIALGRFGWKANQPTLRQQNAAAALGDIGITTSLFPNENIAEGQVAAAAMPSGGVPGHPEMKDDFFDRLTFYTQALAVPAARNVNDEVVRHGASVFEQLACTSCHVPTLVTGDYPDIPALAHRTIHPFTDLLLHDMGPELADGRPDCQATGNEWRTPPLWGIGLTEVVNRHTRFMHDGRARSLEEAILWHGGEAQQSRSKFVQLHKKDREALITFLNNL